MSDDITAAAQKIEVPIKSGGDTVSGAAYDEISTVLVDNPQITSSPSNLRQLSAQLERSGVLGTLTVDEHAIQALPGGSEVVVSSNRPVTLKSADGQITKFTYDHPSGEGSELPTRIEVPGNPPRVYERVKDAATGRYTQQFKDRDGKLISRIDVKHDGTFTVQYESGESVHHHRDNSEVTTDKSGLVTQVRYANGDSDKFEYDGGKPPQITRITETRNGGTKTFVPSIDPGQAVAWKVGDAAGNNLREPSAEEMLTKPTVDADGSLHWKAGDGRLVTRTTGNKEVRAVAPARNDISGVTRDSVGRITEKTLSDSSKITYAYDPNGGSAAAPQRVAIIDKDGAILETFILDQNGKYSHQKWTPLPSGVQGPPAPNGNAETVSHLKITDTTGGFIYKRADGMLIDATPALGSASNTRIPSLSQDALQVSAQQLQKALETKDKDAIRRILEPMTSGDRHALESVYRDLFHKNGAPDALRRDIQTKLGSPEAARYISILDRKPGITNDAAEVDHQLAQLAKGDKNATVAIREVLATLNPDQIQQLDDDLRSHFGDKYLRGLQSALFENDKVSDKEKEVLKVFAKGITNKPDGAPGRTIQDNITLANMALAMHDLNLLGEALRGGHPAAVKAREQLQADTTFTLALEQKFGANNLVARDFLKQGYISLETIANTNNGGYFRGNRNNVELALKNATLEERMRYVHGRDLSFSGKIPAVGSQDEKDLRLYQITHDALIALSRRNEPVSPDVVDPPQTNAELFLRNTLGISQTDLDRYRNEPGARAALDEKVNNLQGGNKFLAQDLLRQLANGSNLNDLSPVDRFLYGRTRPASPQRQLLDAEAILADSQMQKRLLALYGKDTKGYYAAGGTKENIDRDKALLDYIRSAVTFNQGASRAFNSSESILTTMLVEGRLSAGDLADLGFPDSLMQQRLAGEPKKLQEQDRARIAQVYGSQKNTLLDLTKWEDMLVRGGSVITTLADNHKDQNQILQVIEGMSQQDWERLNDPKLRDTFLKDIDDALKLYGVNDDVCKKARALLKARGDAPNYLVAQETNRSILDAGSNKKVLIDHLTHLSAAEQQQYLNNTDNFKQKLDDLIKNSKLDDAQKVFAQRFLSQLQRDGKLPTYDSMSAFDRVLYDNATGANPYKTMDDLESVLQDPTLRKELAKAPILHESLDNAYESHEKIQPAENRILAEIIRNTAEMIANNAYEAGYPTGGWPLMKLQFGQLLEKGKFDLSTKIDLRYPAESLCSEIARQPAQDRQQYVDRLQLTDKQKEIVKYVIVEPQNGKMMLEDQMRALVISDSVPWGAASDKPTYKDFFYHLSVLSPAGLQQLKSQYATKYGSSLDNDFLRKVDSKDYDQYKRLLTPQPGDGRQEYFDALGKLKRTETGYIPQGPDLNAQRALQLYAVALGDAQSDFKTLSRADQEQFNKYFAEGLEQLKQAQKEYAEQLISLGEQAVIFGAGLIAIAASGGTLSPAVMALIVASGGALDGATRVAVMKQVLGNNFDGSVGNVLGEFSQGFMKGGFDTFNMVTLPGAVKGTAELVAGVSGKVATTFSTALDASKGGLDALQSRLGSLIASKGTNALTEADIQQIVRPLLADGVSEAEANNLARLILTETKKRGSQQAAEVFVNNLARTADDGGNLAVRFANGDAATSGIPLNVMHTPEGGLYIDPKNNLPGYQITRRDGTVVKIEGDVPIRIENGDRLTARPKGIEVLSKDGGYVLTDGVHEVPLQLGLKGLIKKVFNLPEGELADPPLFNVNGRILLPGRKYSVGRNSGMDIVNTEPTVSGQHAFIEMYDGKIFLIDNYSLNGTFVNGKKIKQYEFTEIKPGDRITVEGPKGPELFSLNASPVTGLNQPVLTMNALEDSNNFGRLREQSKKLTDGWTDVGSAKLRPDGTFEGLTGVGIVVDRRQDPVLREVIDQAHLQLRAIKSPVERAEKLLEFVRSQLNSQKLDDLALNDWYAKFSQSHAGQRVLLGDFIAMGRGGCAQQAELYKVLADELFQDVRGVKVALARSEDHVWTTIDFGEGRGPRIFDPRAGADINGKFLRQLPQYQIHPEGGIKMVLDGKVVPVNGNEIKIGRVPELGITDPHVSHQHATIHVNPETGKYFYQDHSRNGTWINGQRVHTAVVEIKPGDTLRLGSDSGPLLDLWPGHTKLDPGSVLKWQGHDNWRVQKVLPNGDVVLTNDGIKEVSKETLQILNPQIEQTGIQPGGLYKVMRSDGSIEEWELARYDSSKGKWILQKKDAITEQAPAERLEIVNRPGYNPEKELLYGPTSRDHFLDLDPDQRLLLNQQVDQIIEKFSPAKVSLGEFKDIINSVPAEDRDLAMALLQRSQANASSSGFRQKFKQWHDGGERPSEVIYTLSANSSGNFEGYFLRKSLVDSSISINNIDELIANVTTGVIPHQITIIMDDLMRTPLTAAQREILKKIPKVQIIDTGAFESGINMLDMAQGQDAVRTKLLQLTEQARTWRASYPSATPQDIARQVLYGNVDRVAHSLGPNVRVVHLDSVNSAPLSVDDLYKEMIHVKGSKQAIADYLGRYSPEDRAVLARFLTEGTSYVNFTELMERSRQLNKHILEQLAAKGVDPKDVVYVTNADPGGSSHMVSYLYSRANHVPSEQFVSMKQLQEMAANGTAKNKIVVYLDDTVYSGDQAFGLLNANAGLFGQFKQTVVGSFGTYPQGVETLNKTWLATSGKLDFYYLETKTRLFSPSNEFYKSLSPSEQIILQAAVGRYGHKDTQAQQAWTFMVPDNDVEFLRRFVQSVFDIPGP